MVLVEISGEEYSKIFDKPYHIYNSVPFNILNRAKCKDLHYLLFRDTKPRLGLILGQNQDMLLSPFSAPYGGFSYLDAEIKIDLLDEAHVIFDDYCIHNSIKDVSLVLPPLFYSTSFLSKYISSLTRNGYIGFCIDLNHSLPCEKINEEYTTKILWRNARKNLNISLKKSFIFEKLTNQGDISTVYDVIKINRQKKGYPLKMTLDEVVATSRLVESDAFLLTHDSYPVASAIVFHTAPGIVQVIYWGDDPEFSELKTMNRLSYEIFKYYKDIGVRVIDIGQSTDQGVPNYGLCEFKESIGCVSSLKYAFRKKFK